MWASERKTVGFVDFGCWNTSLNGELAWMYGVARVGMPVAATISFSALMIGEVGVSEVSSAGVV